MPQLVVTPQCQGHGLCYGSFPTLFEPDDEGFGLASPVSATADEAPAAISCCPERAISTEDAPAERADK